MKMRLAYIIVVENAGQRSQEGVDECERILLKWILQVMK
jgi:hypothetical protein